MSSETFEQSCQEVFNKMMAMDDETFFRMLEEHKDGDIAQLLLAANAFEGNDEK
jgi:hypothetical protein